MFKGVFSKYILAFMLIILISFLIILSTITSIISNYSKDTKASLMETAANSSCVYLQNRIENTGTKNIARLTARHHEEIGEMLTAVTSSSNDMTILVATPDGKIVLAVGSDADDIHGDSAIPQAYLSQLGSGRTFWLGQADGVFNEPHLVYSAAVTEERSGEHCGSVFVCASSVIMTDLIEKISKAIIMAILWILMAALIAVYFITERIVGPLKKISVAARQFASGKFDTRVSVTGKDEVAELASAFNNMAESLDNYETMRNTFISNVSHDLRTPMTSIAGFVDGILDGAIPPDKHEYYLRIISNEVKRLSRLVASLLDLSRIQAGERKFTPVIFDICEMSRQIVISFEKQIEEKRLEVEFDCDEENMSAFADKDAIHQIMYNLCDNAVKFSSEGGLFRISVKKLKNRRLLVSVFNEGGGISPEDLPYVFERFYKSDKSRGLNKSGVGLGLYISKTIIDAHDQKIWAESEYEKNCCFSFTLASE